MSHSEVLGVKAYKFGGYTMKPIISDITGRRVGNSEAWAGGGVAAGGQSHRELGQDRRVSLGGMLSRTYSSRGAGGLEPHRADCVLLGNRPPLGGHLGALGQSVAGQDSAAGFPTKF